MARGFIAFSAALLCAALLCASLAFAADKKDDAAIQGTWLPEKAELAGQPFPDEIRKSIKLVIEGDKYTVTLGQKVDRGTIGVDASGKPKNLDIVGSEGPNKGKTIHTIYELDGDTLRVCYDLSGEGRPKEFQTKAGTQLFLVTYKRQKPEADK